MPRILVVEDDPTIGALLASNLRAHGYEVTWVRDGSGALAAAGSTDFDLVLLDIGLPDVSGVEVCRRLRATGPELIVVFLTARTTEMDVVVGLEAGADDYLAKPVRLAELHARLRAHLRRQPATSTSTTAIGDLLVDAGARRASVGGRELPLRAREFDLLARLAAQPGVAISRGTLMADVWDTNWIGSTKTLDVHVAALRRQFRAFADTAAMPVITALRGHGYRLDPPEGRAIVPP